jgi:hypothetical protein
MNAQTTPSAPWPLQWQCRQKAQDHAREAEKLLESPSGSVLAAAHATLALFWQREAW